MEHADATAPRERGRPPRVFPREVLAAIPHWTALGIDRREIAEALGTTVGSLEVRCSQEGISLSGGVAPGVTLQRALRSDKWLRLRRAALARGVPVTQFVVELVDAVLGEDDTHSLLDAVLDDGDGGG